MCVFLTQAAYVFVGGQTDDGDRLSLYLLSMLFLDTLWGGVGRSLSFVPLEFNFIPFM